MNINCVRQERDFVIKPGDIVCWPKLKGEPDYYVVADPKTVNYHDNYDKHWNIFLVNLKNGDIRVWDNEYSFLSIGIHKVNGEVNIK